MKDNEKNTIPVDVDKMWSKEAEAAVLGSMIIDSNCIPDILPILDATFFFIQEHQTIFGALLALYIDDSPIDAIALRTKLKRIGELDKVGGVEYIGRLMDSVPSAANAVYYAGVVRDRKQYRDILRLVGDIREVPNEPLTVAEQVEKIQSLALSIEKSKPADYYTFADDAERIEAEQDAEKTFIETGIRHIDKIISGVSNGELIVPAARPSMGKTTLAVQIAINMAVDGLSILFFTLEMTGKSLIQRALKQKCALSLKELDVTLYENANTPEKQIAIIKNRKQTHKVDVVFVDYLQLMSSGGKNESRVQEISTISRKLKLAAIAENIPIFALSQLNRQPESRAGHRPRLSDLRESGAIEQDADVVMLIHREDYYRRIEDPNADQDGRAEIIIAKNRRGRTGIAELVFLDENVKFENLLRGADYYNDSN